MTHINSLFDRLDAWRHLPAYQLERRADIFFALYMREILGAVFSVEIDGLIPEFPIKQCSSNRSDKVDYLALASNAKRGFLVELKTDIGSRRKTQDAYLERAQSLGLGKLLDGILDIYSATKEKQKYSFLLDELRDFGLLAINRDGTITVMDLDYTLEIVYLQPTNPNRQENTITFSVIANIIERYRDELSLRFAQSLRRWTG